VYMVEVTGATVEECHKRNIHNRSLADIQQAAAQWQETPAVYPLLDLGPLLGLNKKKSKQVSLSLGLNHAHSLSQAAVPQGPSHHLHFLSHALPVHLLSMSPQTLHAVLSLEWGACHKLSCFCESYTGTLSAYLENWSGLLAEIRAVHHVRSLSGCCYRVVCHCHL